MGGIAEGAYEVIKQTSAHKQKLEQLGFTAKKEGEQREEDRKNRLEIARLNRDAATARAANAGRTAALAEEKWDAEKGWSTVKIGLDGKPIRFKLGPEHMLGIRKLEAKEQEEAIHEALWETGQMKIYNQSLETIDLYKRHWGDLVTKQLIESDPKADKIVWTSLADNKDWIKRNLAPRITHRDNMMSKGLNVHVDFIKSKPKQGMVDRRTQLIKALHDKWVVDFGRTKEGLYWVQRAAGENIDEFFDNAVNPPPNSGSYRSTNIDQLASTLEGKSKLQQAINTGNKYGFSSPKSKFTSTNIAKIYTEKLSSSSLLAANAGEYESFLLDIPGEVPNPSSILIKAARASADIYYSASSLAQALTGGNKKEALEIINKGAAYATDDASKALWTSLKGIFEGPGFIENMTVARAYQVGIAYTLARINDTGGKLSRDDYRFSEEMITGKDKQGTIRLVSLQRDRALTEQITHRLLLASNGELDETTVRAYVTSLSEVERLMYSPYTPDRKKAQIMHDAGFDRVMDYYANIGRVKRKDQSSDTEDTKGTSTKTRNILGDTEVESIKKRK